MGCIFHKISKKWWTFLTESPPQWFIKAKKVRLFCAVVFMYIEGTISWKDVGNL